MVKEVEEHKEQLFQGLGEGIDKARVVESTLREAREFIESKSHEVDLIQQQLEKVRQEETNLWETRWGSMELIKN